MLLGLLLLYLAFVLFSNRALFFSAFDEPYWKDRFEHSQWSLPLSSRVIGDDGLYLYEGYRLIRGGNPVQSNAETPPLGKYFIGASVLTFRNGHIYGFITTSLLLAVFYALARRLTKHKLLSIAATLLLATDPLITDQFPLTMLDSLQALFLLGFLLVATHTPKRPGVHAFVLGVMLGGFSSVKFPALAPVVAAVGIVYLRMVHRRLRIVLPFIAGAAVVYLGSYLPYFLSGHTLLEWVRVQKWIVRFYYPTKLEPTYFSALINLLSGQYQNIFSREWSAAAHWSISWPAITVLAVTGGIRLFTDKRRRPEWIAAAGSAAGLLVFFCLIPFWTRYFVVLLPLLYLISTYALRKLNTKLVPAFMGVLLIGNAAAGIPSFFPTPEPTLRQIAFNWEHRYFRDIYQDIDPEGKTRLTRTAFYTTAMNAMYDAEIESVRIRLPDMSYSRFTQNQAVPVEVTYYTRSLGSFTETPVLHFRKTNGRWHLLWDWDLLIRDFHPELRLVTTVNPAKRGTIYASDKKPLAEDAMRPFIWITPGKVRAADEEEMLLLLEQLFDNRLTKLMINQRVVGNTLPDRPVPIGTITHASDDIRIAALRAYPAVTVTEALTRITYPNNVVDIGDVSNSVYPECCSHLYSTTTYDGISGVEKDKNDILKGLSGGSLVLTDADGSIVRTLLSPEKQNGSDTEP